MYMVRHDISSQCSIKWSGVVAVDVGGYTLCVGKSDQGLDEFGCRQVFHNYYVNCPYI